MARRLLILNGLAILGVVINHSIAHGFVAMFWWTDRYFPVSVPNFDQMGTVTYYTFRLVEQTIAFSVPAFLFVSGFYIAFVAGRGQSVGSWRLVVSRSANLFMPYLIWSTITVIGEILLGRSYSLLSLLKLYAIGRAAPPFYFIPLLIQLYFLSPIIIKTAQKNWILLLIVSAIIQLSVQGLRYPLIIGLETPTLILFRDLTPNWLFVGKVFWFSLGISVCLNLERFANWLYQSKRLLLSSLALFLILGMIEWEVLLNLSQQDWIPYYDTAFDSLFAIVFILSFLALDHVKIPLSRIFSELGVRSYGIYLTHSLILTYASKVIYNFAPWLLSTQLLYQGLLISLGIGLPIILMAIVKKSPARKYYPYQFG
jgi:peptidoglycan/LPS O-acetylase OafA/YrhL